MLKRGDIWPERPARLQAGGPVGYANIVWNAMLAGPTGYRLRVRTGSARATLLIATTGHDVTRAIVSTPLRSVQGAQQNSPDLPGPHGRARPGRDLDSTVATVRDAMATAGLPPATSPPGIANQREPRSCGTATTETTTMHRVAGTSTDDMARPCAARTGLAPRPLLRDPIFPPPRSPAPIMWTGPVKPRARTARFGTVDSFLLWRLTGGKVHATDATNASRTLLLDILAGRWDASLCDLFEVPAGLLPEVRDSAGEFGTTDLFGGEIRILALAGDQQAATVGQGCFEPGMMKSTYGTGCFALMNTGAAAVRSRNRLLTTVAYQLGGRRTYALEGAIFIAGAAVQWLRDGLKLIGRGRRSTGSRARPIRPSRFIWLPAFVGLGAPWWDAQARGALYGLTRNRGAAELARGGAGSGRLSDTRSHRGDGGRLAGCVCRRHRAARGRRHDRERT